ncbi:MAG TPA: fibronectin type III domain-containing protein [Thermoplasmata archaeon]|nr:fibronectin type III domain-containing protein [Thermoplasmata archaeon]
MGWVVVGDLVDASGRGVAGALLTVVVAPCPTYPSTDVGIQSCSVWDSNRSASDGRFTIPLPSSPSAYYIYSNRTSTNGGAGRYFLANGTISDLGNLVAPAYVPYGNLTIRLPDYNDMSQFRSGVDQNVQVPLLSWTSDGAFYVNQSFDLVFYNFATGTVTDLARWLPLFRNICYYGCQKNSEWVTQDGSFVYELGCQAVPCNSASILTFYGVNVSTGKTYEWNWTGVNSDDTGMNGQVNVIGLNGSSTDAILTDANGTLFDWNLKNRTQWTLGRLPQFEANNLYWVAPLNSWFNVAADGAVRWTVDQYRFDGRTLLSVANRTWGPGGAPSNFVAGMDYDLTDHRIYFTAGYCNGAAVYTGYATIGPGGNMTNASYLPGGHQCGFPQTLPQGWAGGYPTGSSEHRIGLAAEGPWPAGTWNNSFYNNSWLLDPGTGRWYSTNVSLVWGPPISGLHGEYPAQQAFDEEGFYFDGRYALSEEAMDCYGSLACLIDNASTLGSVYYYWRLGEPRFPTPSDAPLAESTSPPAPVLTSVVSGPTYVNLSWSQPAASVDPLLNYTAYWEDASNRTRSVSLLPTARSVNVTGLTNGQMLSFRIVPLNLHFFGAPLTTVVRVGASGPARTAGPYGLRATENRANSLSLAWSVPAIHAAWQEFVLLYAQRACPLNGTLSLPDFSFVVPIPLANRTSTLGDLFDRASYCFAIAGSSPSGLSDLSNPMGITLGAPYGLISTFRNASAVGLAWSNPSGIASDSVRYGPSCTLGGTTRTLGPATQTTVRDLPSDTTLCFSVSGTAANTTLGNSNEILVTTLPALRGIEPAAIRNGTFGVNSSDVKETVTFVSGASGGDLNSSAIQWLGLPAPACPRLSGWSVDCTFLVPANLTVAVRITDGSGDTNTSSPFPFQVHPLPTGPGLAENRTSVDVGQAVAFGAMVSTWGRLTFRWTGLYDSSCNGLDSATPDCQFGTPGARSVGMTATDPDGGAASFPPILLSVDSPLSIVSAGSNRSGVDVGQTVQFNASVAGGLAPYALEWSDFPRSCLPSNSDSPSCTLTAEIDVYPLVEAQDANGVSTGWVSAGHLLVYADPLAPAPDASLGVVGVGGTVSLTEAASRGTGLYRYLWFGLPPGCSGSSAAVSCLATVSGTYRVGVLVTDSNGYSVVSPSIPLTVQPQNGLFSFGSPESFGLLIAAFGVAGIALLILLPRLRRRRRTEPDAVRRPSTPSAKRTGPPPSRPG